MIALTRQPAIVVIGIFVEGQGPLLLAVQTLDPPRARLGLGQRGQEQRRENPDDSDDDQKFDQGEATLPSPLHPPHIVLRTLPPTLSIRISRSTKWTTK